MKRFCIALVAMFAFGSVFAQPKPVNVVWPYAPGSSQAVLVRTLIDSANAQQSKYLFVFQNKPGAGGSIAANAVLQSNSLTVLAHTSSFYSRPLLYTESHDVDRFVMIGQICEHGPVGLFTRKYTSLDQIQGKEITFGIIPGSLTQVIANAIASQKHFNFVPVPYKDAVTITTDMLGKHIDVGADLVSVANLARMTSDTAMIGVTGTRAINGIKPIKGLELATNSYLLFVPKEVDESTRRELHGIFTQAINTRLVEACRDESGVISPSSYEKQEVIHNTYKKNWVAITRGMTKQ